MTDHDDPAREPAPDPAPGHPPVSDDTAPLQPAWVPPAGPAPAPRSGGFDYPAPGTRPLPAESLPAGHAVPDGRRGRGDRQGSKLGGWLWPAIAAVALVVGVVGGIGGAIAYERLSDDPSDRPGTVSGGLADVDTVSTPPLKGGRSVARVAQELLPSTVQISAQFEGQAGGATGSGFVLDRQGHVITNNHVVADAAENDGPIEIVDQDGNRFDATVVGRSPVYDIAVLFVEDAPELRPAALGSSTQLRVGEGVVAIGSPLGLSSTVTSGIVSALKRPVTTGGSEDDQSYISAVQTDAAINPGNSGGPLVNLQGQVVGVNSAIATSGGGTFSGDAGNIGVGFAIPVEQVQVTADEILRTGEASYPVIGAQVMTGGIDDGSGAKIDEVLADTPAEEAGLEKGDVILAVNGERVSDGIALIVAIRSYQPGQSVDFTYLRDDEELTAEVTLGSETG